MSGPEPAPSPAASFFLSWKDALSSPIALWSACLVAAGLLAASGCGPAATAAADPAESSPSEKSPERNSPERNSPARSSPARSSPAAGSAVTFHRDVAPIVFQHCTQCHRDGEVAPFPLLSYADVKKRAGQIAQVTGDGFMPPWKSKPGHGEFVGERRLTADEIAVLARWAAAGAPEGDPADAPPAPKFVDGWTLGEPDLIVTMPEPFSIPAEGRDIYRNFVLPLSIPEGKYIKALEYRPGNRTVVHHAAFALETSSKSRERDAADPAPGFEGSLVIPGQIFPGALAAWAPGRDPMPLPEGFSLPWPAGSDLILQLHLHPSGKPETERSTIGFYLTDEPPQRSMGDLVLIDKRINIPPGEANYRTRDEYVLPIEMDLYGVFPHMHLIGREMKLTAYPPQGNPLSLLWIEDWDFNWQSFYQYLKPLRLPAQTRIVMEASHDNSADNFRNPFHPPQKITWGEQTNNEMSVAILQLSPVREEELAKVGNARGRLLGNIAAARSAAQPGPAEATAILARAGSFAEASRQLVARFDRNGDGRLDAEELATASGRGVEESRRGAARFDEDGDGALNAEELAKALAALVKAQ